MSVGADEFQQFFKMAHGVDNVTSSTKSGLKCFKCGKILKMNSLKTRLECMSGDVTHEKAFFEYMIEYTDCYRAMFGAIGSPIEFIGLKINPNDTLYVGNLAIYVKNKIVKVK